MRHEVVPGAVVSQSRHPADQHPDPRGSRPGRRFPSRPRRARMPRGRCEKGSGPGERRPVDDLFFHKNRGLGPYRQGDAVRGTGVYFSFKALGGQKNKLSMEGAVDKFIDHHALQS